MMSLLDPGSTSRFHLSENVLTRMVNYELPSVRSLLARRHLNSCAKCRASYERKVHATLEIVEQRQALLKRIGPLPFGRRDLFIRQLDAELQSIRGPWWKKLLPRPAIRPLGSSMPALTSALILIVAGIFLFSALRWPVPAVSAAEFLDRVIVSDLRPAKLSGSGVICRRLLIKTGHKTLQRAIYRDTAGRRQPRYAKAGSEEVELAARLALAGVSWDDPLSAASFKSWHARQTDPIDNVQSAGDGLVTMTTRLPFTSIVQESLTVKEESFHPIKRTVEYRPFGTIEISEVSEDVLSTADAKQLFFEGETSGSASVRRMPAPNLLPSTTQLNETELEARLTLNRMNADTGEQIEITRNDKQVRVKGLVETEERKKELNQSLKTLPFLDVTMESFDDLKSASSSGSQITSIHQQSTSSAVSPLEDYFVAHGHTRSDLSRISAGLFNCSLAINRSTRSMEQIELRFSADEDLSPTAIRARDELLLRSAERLLADLDKQQQFLDDAGIASESNVGPKNAEADSVSLTDLAGRNMAATKWLISSPDEADRSEMLKTQAAELAETISQLRTAAFTYIPNHAKP